MHLVQMGRSPYLFNTKWVAPLAQRINDNYGDQLHVRVIFAKKKI
jgi:hypothetical protein